MQRVNELAVRGPHAEVRKLVERVERNPLFADWKRDASAEAKLNANLDVTTPGVFCFVLDDPSMRPVTLILARKGWDELHVSSLITKDRRPLSDVEYNRILGDFFANVLVPLSLGIKLDLDMTPARGEVEQYLSPDALGRLLEFSAASKKDTTSLPDGLKWDRFIIQAYRDGALLDGEELHYWLLSDGFSQEDSDRLLESFEEGWSLLAAYDEERVH